MSQYKILKEYETNLTLLEDIIGDGPTDNIELNKVCKYLFGNLFIGVYSDDKIPLLNNNQMCIVNTDDKAGIHCCVFCINTKINHMYMIHLIKM